MSKLEQKNQFVPSVPAVQRILDQYNLTLTRYEPATGGIENLTLLIWADAHRYVLRIYRQRKKTDAEITRELDFMAFLQKHGLPLPAVVPSVNGEKFVLTDIDGKSWQSILMKHAPGGHPRHYTPTLLDDMAKLQAKMHLLGQRYTAERNIHDGLKELRETFVAEQLLDDPTIQNERRAFIQRTQQYVVKLDASLPRGLSHFDYGADNLFADESGHVTAILDFDDVQYLPLVVCLAYTLWDILSETDNDLDLIGRYLQTYEAARPLQASEKKILPGIILFRHYFVTAFRIHLGECDNTVFEKALAQEKYLVNFYPKF